MAKKRLGRGLDSLLQVKKDINASTASKDAKATQELAMDIIHRGKYQPRRHINEAEINSLAESIKSVGIIQPIIVRAISESEYEIVAGERRWHAAQKAGFTHIPAIIKDIDDETAAAMALVENIQRQDLNVIEEAYGMQKLINDFQLTQQQLANLLGKSRSTVSNLLRLLELPTAVKQLVEDGILDMGHVRALLSLPKAIQFATAQQAVANSWTTRQTEAKVKELLAGKNDKAESSENTAENTAENRDTINLQEQISSLLGTTVKIDHNKTGKGKIVVNYSNLDQLQDIIQKISK